MARIASGFELWSNDLLENIVARRQGTGMISSTPRSCNCWSTSYAASTASAWVSGARSSRERKSDYRHAAEFLEESVEPFGSPRFTSSSAVARVHFPGG